MKQTIIDFFKPTKLKVLVAITCPCFGLLVLLLGFILDEISGISGSVIVNAVYLFAYIFYPFILLPFTFTTNVTTSPFIVKVTLVLALVWWYLLACTIIFLFKKWQKSKTSN